ncbi:5-methylcytosine-specific restriction endonuclease system specificity protein McrC [Clostridium beijerinckii]|nr:5-methylcytosine-specific restriction endonuclease system specificity protein McrC [Clostridium beijerinckii]
MNSSNYQLKIPIRNIYCMLSYAYNVLKQDSFEKLGEEKFENIYDLLTEILIIGIRKQVKQGIYKEYINNDEPLSVVRGKIDIGKSIQLKVKSSMKLHCVYDEFSSDNILNQIIKSTCIKLIKNDEVNVAKKKKLKSLMLYFGEISEITIKHIEWSKLRYHKNNLTYKMLINICYLINEGLIVNETQGKNKFVTFIKDRQMAILYEKFIYEFYRQEFPQYKVKYQEQIKWKSDNNYIDFLPNMNTDISIANGNRKLIIDTKFYSECMQKNYLSNNKSFISGNLYQIFTYVKNSNFDGNVSGMLLYPTVSYEVSEDYQLSGNDIFIRCVDLNREFFEISDKLKEIIKQYLMDNAI